MPAIAYRRLSSEEVGLLPVLSPVSGSFRSLSKRWPQHRHQEFVRVLDAVERAVPAGKLIHAIADTYATHKHPKVCAWLERHPRWVFHFTPTSASWINAVSSQR